MSQDIPRPNAEPIYHDIEAQSINGFIGLVLHILLGLFNFILLVSNSLAALILLITGPIWLIYWKSYVIVNPN